MPLVPRVLSGIQLLLLSLDDNPGDINKLVSRYYFGVQAFHEVMPSSENYISDMTISVLPWIYGSKRSAPDEIESVVTETERFHNISKQRLSESKRLLYVAT